MLVWTRLGSTTALSDLTIAAQKDRELARGVAAARSWILGTCPEKMYRTVSKQWREHNKSHRAEGFSASRR